MCQGSCINKQALLYKKRTFYGVILTAWNVKAKDKLLNNPSNFLCNSQFLYCITCQFAMNIISNNDSLELISKVNKISIFIPKIKVKMGYQRAQSTQKEKCTKSKKIKLK